MSATFKNALAGALLATSLFGAQQGKTAPGVDVYAETATPELGVNKAQFTGKRFVAGAPVKFSTYVMKGTDKRNAPLFLLMEFDEKGTPAAMEKYAGEGLIPPGLVVFLANDSIRPTVKGGFTRYMRGTLFAPVGREFPDMLVEELIPHAAEQSGVTISPDPDMHFVSGSSAGGGATLNIVWYRNDYFRRAYAISPVVDPSFVMLARRMEAKTLRIYITTGDCEPDRVGGDLFFSNFALCSSLDYAGYPCEHEYFPRGGHNAGKGSPETMRRMFGFTWEGWKEGKKVVPPRNPIRVAGLVAGSGWTEVQAAIPPKKTVRAAGGEYSADGGKIVFRDSNGASRTVADGFGKVEGISLSSDLWRLYAVDSSRMCIFAMTVAKDGSLGYPFRHTDIMLHPDARRLGASDILTLENDRVLVATELGVQSAMSFGTLDVILPLPGDVPADRVWMEGKTLFASSGARVFRRELQIAASDGTKITEPDRAYYHVPGENRNSGHLAILAPAIDAARSIVITNRIER